MSTLEDAYPTLGTLSPELKRLCILHLTHSLLETIPYLSSKYLSPEEQAKVAKQCVILEFSTGEKFCKHPELGRGALIFRKGFGVTSRKVPKKNFKWSKALKDKPIDVEDVLVDDDFCKENQLVYHFVGYTRVLFVPRSAIINVLSSNEKAWKECGRWRYFMASFILFALKKSEA